MTNIKIFQKNSLISEIIIEGHADYDVKGKDIVCAAISSITYGTINALNELVKKPQFAIEDGYSLIKFETDEKSQIIANTMIIQLKTVEENYKKNVKIIYS